MKKYLLLLIILSAWPLTIVAMPSSHIVISEIKISGGTGYSADEFIELYNPTGQSASLEGWRLIKKTAQGSEYILLDNFGDQKISSHTYFLIAHPAGYAGQVQPDLYYSTTNSIADNNTIILLNDLGEEIDKVGYGTTSDYEGMVITNPVAGKSLERKARIDSTEDLMIEGGTHYFLGNGEDADNNSNDFIIRSIPEPQNSFSELEYLDIIIPIIPPSDSVNTPNAPAVDIAYSDKIIITELFPNPEGTDDAEFIELFNRGSQSVNLLGWQLGDNSTLRYTFSQSDFSDLLIEPDGYFIIDKEISKISLNNTTDTAKLYQPNGNLLVSAKYNSCQENRSYSLVEEKWLWTDQITRGVTNEYELNNALPVAEFEVSDEDLKVGQVVVFDATNTSDPDKDAMEYFWDFGDGEKAKGPKIEHVYKVSGEYLVSLLVLDARGGEAEIGVTFLVTDYDYTDKLFITEILPDCSGPDEECEFIELYNADDREINLKGWSITDTKKIYRFEKDSIIDSGDYMSINKNVSKITLNNDGKAIYLINPKDEIIYGVEYGKSKSDYSFSLDMANNNWQWSVTPTPGEINVLESELITIESEIEDDNISINIEIKDISEEYLGKILTVSGEVESAKKTGIYLMDESGHTIRVYIQTKTGIPWPDITAGDFMEVTGVLDKTSAGLRLLPEKNEDIKITKAGLKEAKVEEPQVLGAAIDQQAIDITQKDSGQEVVKYLYICIGFLIMVIIGVSIKYFINNKQSKKIKEDIY